MRIENNYVKGAGGDAITLMYCDRPVIEHNVGDSVSKHMNNVDYPHDPAHGGRYGGWVAAGIWPWRCKDPIFQYNEMYNNLNSEHGNGDGQAWDADYGDGTLYQYNYSYGNSFASLMICNWYAVNTTFRYNISQNDRQGVFDLPSNGPGNHIYNNTVYVDADSQVLTKRSNSQSLFENNIFINATNTKKTETWNRGSQNGGQTYDNNMYVNYANKPTSDGQRHRGRRRVRSACGRRFGSDIRPQERRRACAHRRESRVRRLPSGRGLEGDQRRQGRLRPQRLRGGERLPRQRSQGQARSGRRGKRRGVRHDGLLQVRDRNRNRFRDR